MPLIQFNLVDIPLIATIIECGLIAMLVKIIPTPSELSRRLLALFFLAIAIDALCMLLIWNAGVRDLLRDLSPVTITLTTLALMTKGPLLLFYIKTISSEQFSLKKKHLWHALPIVFALIIAIIFELSTTKLTTPIEAHIDNWGTLYWWTLLRASPVFYCLITLHAIRNLSSLYDKHYSGSEYLDAKWIRMLLIGFFLQWLLGLIVHLTGQYLPNGVASAFGQISDFVAFILINILLLYSFTLIKRLIPLVQEMSIQDATDPIASDTEAPTTADDCSDINQLSQLQKECLPVNNSEPEPTLDSPNLESSSIDSPKAQSVELPVIILPPNSELKTPQDKKRLAKIKTLMINDRAYLNSTINLQRFSRAVGAPTKEVSRIINSTFDMNFSEFVNSYRIKEAQALLIDPKYIDSPIVDIINLSGFNSKSAFHRYFNRFTDLSPTEYRQKILEGSRDKSPQAIS